MNSFNRTYGLDLFSIFLILIASILNIFDVTRIFSVIILFYALYRMLSRNFQKRQQEYMKFSMYLNKILGIFHKSIPSYVQPLHLSDYAPIFDNLKRKSNDRKNYKIVKCPKCHQKLRLPRHKGRITVTCKKCLHEFKMKS